MPTTIERKWRGSNLLGASAWRWQRRNCAWPCIINSSQAAMLSDSRRTGPIAPRRSTSRIQPGKKV